MQKTNHQGKGRNPCDARGFIAVSPPERVPLRRATIYGLLSYGGLVLINNSELDLPNMWIAYLPMFIGVYVVTQWLDKKLGD